MYQAQKCKMQVIDNAAYVFEPIMTTQHLYDETD